ncbi:MAG: sulfatase-like hydrolase/transferase [Bryobacteraceae bacterium]
MPNIDRLAREGARLTDNYSAGLVCTPRRAALITGRLLTHFPPAVNAAFAAGAELLYALTEGPCE